jgi:uncharacterized protein YoxC
MEMAEEPKVKNVDALLKQIEEFQKTIKGLEDNVTGLKKRLQENKDKYGADMTQWPKDQ